MRSILLRSMCVTAIATAASCEPPQSQPIDADAHRASVEAWRQTRIEKLTRPDGWLTPVGLFWLHEGSYTFGRDSSNDFAYATASDALPARIGTFTVHATGVRFDADPGVTVTLQGEPVVSYEVAPDSGPAPVLRLGSLEWFVIRRSGERAVRVKDAESAVRTAFVPGDIPLFPADVVWRLPARFEWKDPPDTIDIPNILGNINRTPSPASVRFEVAGQRYRLALWKDSDDPDNFFTAFADGTNGIQTYGGGRFLWIDAPDAEGYTVVDFNRAYNPPCVFTSFATCPLPPRSNRLPFDIAAGEKSYTKH